MTGDIRARASLVRGRPPRAGVGTATYAWDDLVAGPPPRRTRRGEGEYVVFDGLEVGHDLRLTYSTLVSVDPGVDAHDTRDDVITVDARVTVQRPAFFELMHRERIVMDAWASRARMRVARHLARQRRAAVRLHARPLVRAASFVIRQEARILHGAVRLARNAARAVIRFPDHLATRAAHARGHLEGRGARRGIWAGIKDPSRLSNEQKGVVLTLTLLALVGGVVLLNTLLLFAWPSAAVAYRAALSDATASLLGVVALPIPVELLLVSGVLARGIAIVVASLLVGKMLGAWMLYLLGDALNGTILKMTTGRPRVSRAVEWMRAGANRYGFLLLAVINAAPFVPDALVYVFAVSGMRFRAYFLGILVGTAAKFAWIILALELIGAERVRAFLGG